ncbi:hypothetical protein GCM10023210_33210 [Chryseobacterium ginsengisoli]|uniref:DUF3892 domain-containing protein n=1 Tax=Chryseobacterium ginsengisoli TaxID=363853 RepID=A0ABP9MNM0_9FLAO
MAQYAISGVWKDTNGVITDYAVHLLTERNTPNTFDVAKAEKYSKAEAIRLVNNHYVRTAIWDYNRKLWSLGAEVSVVDNYLRSDADSTVRDNLENLLNYWNITIGCN